MENPSFTYLQLCDEPIKNLKAVAKAMEIEGADKKRKQDLIREILKIQLAAEGLTLSEGVLDIMPEGYNFLHIKNYIQKLK